MMNSSPQPIPQYVPFAPIRWMFAALIFVAISGVLLGVAYRLWGDFFTMTVCMPESEESRMEEIVFAMQCYEELHGCLPPPCSRDAEGKPLHSWRVLLLPWLDANLYDQIRLDEPWDSTWNTQFHNQMPEVFREIDHGSVSLSQTSLTVMVGENMAFRPDSKPVRSREMTDGSENTIVLMNSKFRFCWMDPTSYLVWKTFPEEGDISVFAPQTLRATTLAGNTISFEGISLADFKDYLTVDGGESAPLYMEILQDDEDSLSQDADLSE